MVVSELLEYASPGIGHVPLSRLHPLHLQGLYASLIEGGLGGGTVLNLHLGVADVGASPKDTQQRQAYDLLTDGFGVGQNGPLLIAAQLGKPAKADQKNLDSIADQQSLNCVRAGARLRR